MCGNTTGAAVSKCVKDGQETGVFKISSLTWAASRLRNTPSTASTTTAITSQETAVGLRKSNNLKIEDHAPIWHEETCERLKDCDALKRRVNEHSCCVAQNE